MLNTVVFLDQLIGNGIEKIIGVTCYFLGWIINEAENSVMN